MKFREFVLLVLIIFFGVLFHHVHTGKLELDYDWENGLFFSFQEFTFEETLDLAPPFPPEIFMINTHGRIDMEGTETDRISLRLVKRLRRRTREQAEEIAADLHPVVSRDDREMTISSNRSDFNRRNFSTDFEITLPAGLSVQVKNSHGTARIVNLAGVDIDNHHGSVTARDIAGDLILRNSYEDVTAARIGGDCQVESRHSRLDISDVGGNLRVSHRYGRVDLSGIRRETTIEGSHTWISGRALPGGLEIDTSYEGIELADTGPVFIRGRHTSIDLEAINGKLEIRNEHDAVDIAGLRGDLDIQGKSLRITGKDIVSDQLIIDTSHQNVDLEDFSGSSTISLRHGELRLAPAPLTHAIVVKGENAGIRLFWPGDAAYPFEAQNKGGDIQWNLLREPSLRMDNGVSVVKAFLEENILPSITLSTSYDSILVLKK